MGFGLDSIITGRERKPPIAVFYGPQGIGKTTWAASAPKPIFIQCEDGIGTLDFARFPRPKTFEDVLECISTLGREQHPFKTVVIDTLSSLEKLIHADVRAKHGQQIFANYGKGYELSLPYVDRFTSYLERLRDSKGIMVLVLAHCDVKRYEPPESQAYDRYVLNCHEKVAKRLHHWCDLMLFANYKVFVKEEDAGFNQKRARATGGDERIIYTQQRPAFLAKNRYDLPFELPFPKDFYWDRLLAEIDRKLADGKPPEAEKCDRPGADEPPTNEEEEMAAARANGLTEEG